MTLLFTVSLVAVLLLTVAGVSPGLSSSIPKEEQEEDRQLGYHDDGYSYYDDGYGYHDDGYYGYDDDYYYGGGKYLKNIGNNMGYGAYDECEGDCDYNKDCKGSLKCYQDEHSEYVPGCKGRRGHHPVHGYVDYCYDPYSGKGKGKGYRKKNI